MEGTGAVLVLGGPGVALTVGLGCTWFLPLEEGGWVAGASGGWQMTLRV